MSIEPFSSATAEPGAVKPAPLSLSLTAEADPAFDERWAAWQTRGAAHDRATGRRMIIAAPILVLVAGLVAFILAR